MAACITATRGKRPDPPRCRLPTPPGNTGALPWLRARVGPGSCPAARTPCEPSLQAPARPTEAGRGRGRGLRDGQASQTVAAVGFRHQPGRRPSGRLAAHPSVASTATPKAPIPTSAERPCLAPPDAPRSSAPPPGGAPAPRARQCTGYPTRSHACPVRPSFRESIRVDKVRYVRKGRFYRDRSSRQRRSLGDLVS